MAKITGNMRRDLDTSERLAQDGWLVLRFWVHDDVDAVVEAVAAAVTARRTRTGSTLSRRQVGPFTEAPATDGQPLSDRAAQDDY